MLWRERGWNVGIFYWNELADDDISSAERKIQDAGEPMHWLRRNTDGSTELRLAPEGTGCVAAQLAAALEPLWKASCCPAEGAEAPQLRLVGHSLGAQLIIAAARRLLADHPPQCIRHKSVLCSHTEPLQTHLVAARPQPSTGRRIEGCAEGVLTCDAMGGAAGGEEGSAEDGAEDGAQGSLEGGSEDGLGFVPKPKSLEVARAMGGGETARLDIVAPLRIALLDPFCSKGVKEWLSGATPQQRADESLEALCRALPSTVVECYRTSVLGNPPLAWLSELWGERCELLHRRAAFTYVSPRQVHPWDVRSRHIAAFSLYFLSMAAAANHGAPRKCDSGSDYQYQQSWHGAMHPGAPDEFIREMMGCDLS